MATRSVPRIDFNKNGAITPYEDPQRPIEDRVENLWEQMTVEDNLSHLVSLFIYSQVVKGPLPAPT